MTIIVRDCRLPFRILMLNTPFIKTADGWTWRSKAGVRIRGHNLTI